MMKIPSSPDFTSPICVIDELQKHHYEQLAKSNRMSSIGEEDHFLLLMNPQGRIVERIRKGKNNSGGLPMAPNMMKDDDDDDVYPDKRSNNNNNRNSCDNDQKDGRCCTVDGDCKDHRDDADDDDEECLPPSCSSSPMHQPKPQPTAAAAAALVAGPSFPISILRSSNQSDVDDRERRSRKMKKVRSVSFQIPSCQVRPKPEHQSPCTQRQSETDSNRNDPDCFNEPSQLVKSSLLSPTVETAPLRSPASVIHWDKDENESFYKQARRQAKWIHMMMHNDTPSDDNHEEGDDDDVIGRSRSNNCVSGLLQALYQDATQESQLSRLLNSPTACRLLQVCTSLSSRNDGDYSIRGLEPFLHPCIKRQRRIHVQGVLTIQRALSNHHQPLDDSATAHVLRTRSLQTSRASRVLARLLAHFDYLQVTELLRQELQHHDDNNHAMMRTCSLTFGRLHQQQQSRQLEVEALPTHGTLPGGGVVAAVTCAKIGEPYGKRNHPTKTMRKKCNDQQQLKRHASSVSPERGRHRAWP